MKHGELIHKSHPKRLFLLLIGVVVLFSLSSSIYLYIDVYRPLSTHYSAVVSLVSDVHETLIVKTLKINTLFFALITVGIVILGVLYTHRVCGPLKRVQRFAESVSEGDMCSKISFREKDAIHPFGETFNDMTESYEIRINSIKADMEELKGLLEEVRSRKREGKETADLLEKAMETDRRIREVLSTVKS